MLNEVTCSYADTHARVQATFMHKAYKQYEHDAWSSKAMLKTIRSKISKGEVLLFMCLLGIHACVYFAHAQVQARV